MEPRRLMRRRKNSCIEIHRFCDENSYRLACWNADVELFRMMLEVGARKQRIEGMSIQSFQNASKTKLVLWKALVLAIRLTFINVKLI